jgi:hypothetical protein
MAAKPPRDSLIAVVGDGFGSLIVYSTAIYVGFRPEQITVYGTNDNPVATYQQYAYNLGQTVLRSESESHFLPADWPTFAQLDAWSRKSLSPLLRSVNRKYNPGVPDILAEAAAVQKRLGWNDNRVPRRVGWLQREFGPPPHFVFYDEDANYLGRAKHVMLAIGHGPLQFPPLLARARENPEIGDRIVQAYEPKAYTAGGTYIVIGSGIASVNEWVNAIDVGAKVVALLRNPTPDEQDLNTPRCLFEALGIDIFQGLPLDQRLAFLGKVLRGTSPKRRSWGATVARARAEGRFDEVIGEIDDVQPGPAGLRVHIAATQGGQSPGWLDVTGVVAGTGFNKSALTIPLLRRLIEYYKLELSDGKINLRTNCGLPGLDMEESRICLMGLIANSVIPHGDTIAGLKYIGRRFVGDCARAEGVRPRNFFSRFGMQVSLGSESAKAIRQVRHVKQLA